MQDVATDPFRRAVYMPSCPLTPTQLADIERHFRTVREPDPSLYQSIADTMHCHEP